MAEQEPISDHGKGQQRFLPVLGMFAGFLIHDVLPRGAFGPYDVAMRAAITAATTAATVWLVMVAFRRFDRQPR